MRKFSHKAMDAEFSVSFGLNADEALCSAAAAACFARIDALELLLTRFNDTSDVAVIRGLPDGGIATVARETMDVLVASARVCAATGGAFDPTVERRNFAELTLDVEHVRVGVRKGPVALDFGGIGKGYALDACAEILRSEQFDLHDWLLDAGSSTQVIGGGPWALGIGGRWEGRTRQATVLRLSDGALSGSGFEVRGEHIFDVRRGGPAVRWAQSWSRARTGAVADALSTAALALDARELAAACRELEAGVWVAREQRPWLDRLRDPLTKFGRVP